MFFPARMPNDAQGAFERLAWFIRCGKPEDNAKPRRPDFDFAHDAGIIFASFWAQYSIDLTVVRLHWWKFSALFTGLGEQTIFRQVLGLRNRKEDGMDTKAKQELRDAKKAWALPVDAYQEKRSNALADALLKGDAAAVQRALK
jgi:hypothetical protein